MSKTKAKFRRALSGFLAFVLLCTMAGTSMTVFAADAVSYIDENGNTQTITSYSTVSSSDTTWSDGWYVLTENITNSNRITVSGTANLILKDGYELTASSGITVNSGNTLNIYGQSNSSGTLTAGASASAAAIGSNNWKSGGTIVINGGIINATGGRYGAGIGGGEEGSGTIVINSGTINATGGYQGAGIGGGNEGTGSTITINGGTVNAAGGERAAGIGCGWRDNGSTINIEGGTVTATGGYDAAGIGGGESVGGGTININGGTITATGGTGGAGIGGGSSGSGDNTTICGGTVTANGGKYAAGIGGGYEGAGGEITINGGTINATGGGNGAGIGGGSNGGQGSAVTITGGTIVATSDSNAEGIGHGQGENISDSFSTGDAGQAVIYATSISDTSDKDNWSGIISRSSTTGPATVYGSPVITMDEEIPSGCTAEFESGKTVTIASDVTFTNNGTIYQDYGSTITKNGAFTDTGITYYEIAGDVSVEGDTVTTYSEKTYALANDSITVINGCKGATYTEEAVEITNSLFTMPAEPVQLSAHEIDTENPYKYVAPTCTTTGTEAVYKCKNCDAIFVADESEESGYREISSVDEAGVIQATGHDWNWDEEQIRYHWEEIYDNESNIIGYTCTATVECNNDKNHIFEDEAGAGCITCTVTPEVTNATCEGTGKTVYTASFTVTDEKGEEHSATCLYTKEVSIPATGHDYDYNNVTYYWAKDYSACYAEITCTKDDSHHTYFTSTSVSADTTYPTCTDDGSTKYTATFSVEGHPEYGATETVTLPATGHDARLQHVEAKAAKCEEEGNIAYYYCDTCKATFSDPYADYPLDADDITIEALGHNYDAEHVTFTWSDDDISHLDDVKCTAVFTCTDCGKESDEITCDVNRITDNDHVASCTTPDDHDVRATATIANPRDNNATVTATEDEIIYGVALGHTWDEKTLDFFWGEAHNCVILVECSKCDTVAATEVYYTEGNTSEMSNVVYKEVTAPTCTEAGVITYTATGSITDPFSKDTIELNGETVFTEAKTEKGEDALGHDLDDGVVTTAPTCTKEGKKTYTCKRSCGYTETEVIEPTGHTIDYDNPVYTVEPTCTTDGMAYYACTCESCGDDCDCNTNTVKDALGEDVLENGEPIYYYESEVLTATGHGELTYVPPVAPTCTENGKIGYWQCDTCKAMFSDPYAHTELFAKDIIDPATGHSWPEEAEFSWSVEDGIASCTVTTVCENCGISMSKVVTGIEAESTTPATCTEDATATYKVTVTFTANDEKEATAHPASVKPLAPEAIVAEYENTWVYTYEGTAGHTPVTDAAVEPNCTDTGLTEGSHCSVCNEVLVEQTVIPANGHTPLDAVAENIAEPTCTEKGSYESVIYCEVCGEELSRTPVDVDATGHTPLEAVTENYTEPTCTETGSYDSVVYCEVCGEEVSRSEIIVDALGHTVVTDPAVDPTCTETGLTEGSHCSVCGEIITAQEVIPALGHETEYYPAVEATALQGGNIEYWYCKVCDRYFADEACTIEISLEDTVIPAIGLTPVEVIDAETGEIITVYFDEESGIYYADPEGRTVIQPDSIIIPGEEVTTEEVTESETEDDGTGITGEANEENDTVNGETGEEEEETEAEEAEEETEELEEDESESEESESAVAANTSSTSPQTGASIAALAAAMSLAAAGIVVVTRKKKED